MSAIWKFELPTRGVATVQMPRGAVVLSVANQNERLQLWALVNPRAPLEERSFLIALTGSVGRIDIQPGQFVGTVLFADGTFVAHVFQLTE